MEHYFSKNPQVKSDKKTFTYEIEKFKLTFNYDHGVFSKGSQDAGSELLVKTFISSNPSHLEAKVLDLGTGYGFIGVVLKKFLTEVSLTMTDINTRAVELAKENTNANNVTATIFQSDGFEHIDSNFNFILLNPPIRIGKENVYKLLKDSYDHLEESGELWIVVRVKQGAKSMGKFLEGFFKEVVTIEKKSGYHILRCSK